MKMDSSTIDKVLRNKAKNAFLGVFPRDKIPSTLPTQRPVLFIANTDISSGPGKHWVAFFYPKSGRPEFFDSAGRKPSDYGFHGHFKHKRRRLQAHDSNVCGQFSIYYLFQRLNGKNPIEIYKHFGRNLDNNDAYVRKYYNTLLRI